MVKAWIQECLLSSLEMHKQCRHCWEAEELLLGPRAGTEPGSPEEARAAQPALSHGVFPTATPLKPGRNGTLPAMGMVYGVCGQNWLPSNTECQAGALCSCGSGVEEQIWNKWSLQGLNVPAHHEESFSYRHLEPNGSVLSPDGAKYLECSKICPHWVGNMGVDSWHLVISINGKLPVIIT